MFSLEPPTKDVGEFAHRVAVISGEDFPAGSAASIYKGLSRAEAQASHFAETVAAVEQLAADNDNTTYVRRGDRWVEDATVPVMESLMRRGHAVQLYGKNRFECLHADRREGQTHAIYVAAAPGAGKSYWLARYAESFTALYGSTARVIVVSLKDFAREEPEFARVKFQQVPIDAAFVESPLTVAAVRALHAKVAAEGGKTAPATLVVYDDVGMLTGDKLAAVVASFNNMINLGRSLHVSVVVTNHSLAAGSFSQKIWNSCTHAVMFPSTHPEKVRSALVARLQLKEPVADALMEHTPRWLCLSMGAPQIALTPSTLVNVDELSKELRRARTK